MGLRLLGSTRESWRGVDFAALDLETTGLDPARDAVVSYGVVPIARGRARLDAAVYEVVNPGRSLPPEVVRVHGIRPVDLDRASSPEEAAGRLRGSLEGRVVLAWAAWVEAAFLTSFLGGRRSRWGREILDVRRLAVFLDESEGRRPSPARRQTLAATAERFGVPPDLEHHALWDAFVTAQLFLVVASHLERGGLGNLGALRRADHGVRWR